MKICDIKNKEYGKRCFILGNGPSIRNLNLSLLKNEISIGVNASSILQKEYKFSQTYYTVSDARFLRNPEKVDYATKMIDETTIKVFRSSLKENLTSKYAKNTIFVEALEMFGFSFDLEQGYFFGRTTVMLAMQLAYYLGCKEIYLLGVDLNYGNVGKRFYNTKNLELDDITASVQIRSFLYSYDVLKYKGVKLFNCSEVSLLRNYIPYKAFNDIFI